ADVRLPRPRRQRLRHYRNLTRPRPAPSASGGACRMARMSKPRVSDLVMLVDLLAGVDTGRRVFGAVMHNYRRGPALTDAAVWTDHSHQEGPLVPEESDFLTWYRRWLDQAFQTWAVRALPAMTWSAVLASPAGGAEIPAAVRSLVRPLLAASKDAEAQLSLG